MSSNKKIEYFNTLIFTVITGIVSLIVLCMLFFDFGKKFVYLIIMFELGVFVIIGLCIYEIMKAETKKTNVDGYQIRFNQCPDYYSSVSLNGTDYCMNWFQGKDAFGKDVIIRVYPLQDSFGNEITVNKEFPASELTPAQTSTYTNFALYDLEKEERLPTQNKKCDVIFKPSRDTNLAKYAGHSVVPWTYARSRCQSLSDFSS